MCFFNLFARKYSVGFNCFLLSFHPTTFERFEDVSQMGGDYPPARYIDFMTKNLAVLVAGVLGQISLLVVQW